jgi:hypothetical protein
MIDCFPSWAVLCYILCTLAKIMESVIYMDFRELIHDYRKTQRAVRNLKLPV